MLRYGLISLVAFVLIYCHSPEPKTVVKEISEKKSRMLEFHYGGYGDTIYATLEGMVYETDSSNSLVPLSNVTITVNPNGNYTTTDSTGQFVTRNNAGIFSLLFKKPGYQSLQLTNYISDPDQFSGTKVILEKGEDIQKVKIGNRN